MTGGRTSLKSGADMRGHLARYRLAAGFVSQEDVVVDAACGTGYGANILQSHAFVQYIGIDVDLSDVEVSVDRPGRRFMQWDLTVPLMLSFDVFVGFETMEHLADFTAWVDLARQARRWILLSVPTVPTVETNPHHVRDFLPGEAVTYFIGDGWELWQTLLQPWENSEIYILKRTETT